MSSRLGLCQRDSNCKIEGESHLHGMDVWQCGYGLYCYAVEVNETRVSNSTGMRYQYEFRDLKKKKKRIEIGSVHVIFFSCF